MIPAGAKSPRLWAAAGAVTCGLAVVLGAYGWHDLEADTDMREIFMLSVQYHMWHGLALFAVAWLAETGGRAAALAALAGCAFLGGIVLFSGNLYGLAVTGEPPVIGGAPFGGFALMAGWALLAGAALVRRKAG